MTTTTNDITAAQWLDIRDHVAQRVKAHVSPQTKYETTVNIAEGLLRAGLIDIEAVLEAIKPAAPAKVVKIGIHDGVAGARVVTEPVK